MREEFEKVIQNFCNICGIQDAKSIMHGASVVVDETSFAFGYNNDVPDRIFVYCDYGSVPKEEEAKIYRALLETNLFLYDTDVAVYSLLPNSGNVICSTRYSLKGLTAEDLRRAMIFLSQKAKEWSVHYLDPQKMGIDVKTIHKTSSASAQNIMKNFNK